MSEDCGCGTECSDVSRGNTGAAGTSSYLYPGYASDAAGSNFSLVPSSTLPFISLLIKQGAAVNLTVSDFPLPFIQYIGTGGAAGTNGTNGTTILLIDSTAINPSLGSANETLKSYTLPANTLSVNGNYIEVEGYVVGGATATPLVQCTMTFSGNNIGMSGGSSPLFPSQQFGITTKYKFRVRIIRKTSTSFNFDFEILPLGATGMMVGGTVGISAGGVDFTTNMVLNFNMDKQGNSISDTSSFNLVNYTVKKYIQ